jgi:hypothetical protein
MKSIAYLVYDSWIYQELRTYSKYYPSNTAIAINGIWAWVWKIALVGSAKVSQKKHVGSYYPNIITKTQQAFTDEQFRFFFNFSLACKLSARAMRQEKEVKAMAGTNVISRAVIGGMDFLG